jgi:hypothetical protein
MHDDEQSVRVLELPAIRIAVGRGGILGDDDEAGE